MTRAIESLKTSPFHEYKLYDRIADTYFHQKTRQKTRHKKDKFPAKELKTAFIWLFLAAAAVTASIILYSSLRGQYINSLRERVANSNVLVISEGGNFNRDILGRLELRGYAKGNGKFLKEAVMLKNPKKYNWADMALDFKFPIDFSGKTLAFALKGELGGERVSLVLRDMNNRAARLSDIYLTSDWKTKSIALNDVVGGNIDLTGITHMRLEYGYIGESSKEMDLPIDLTIYVKDIKLLNP